jgi:hypothetical protein
MSRFATAIVIVTAGLGVARAQDLRIEQPKTPAEFWSALEFELNTGKYDVAAYYLKGFVALDPSEKDLVALEREKGMSAFLRLRTVQQWSSDAKVETEARQNAETVIEKVTAALKKELNDPQRIAKFVANLRGIPEEREYALRELQRSGGAAMPHLIAALKSDTDPIQRSLILNILPRLFSDSVPPLLAALDMDDAVVKTLLLQALGERNDLPILVNRAETNPLPTLDYLAASPRQPDTVRRKAAEVRARVRPVSPSRQPIAKVELTRAADRLYRHESPFTNPENVPIWRWAENNLVPFEAKQTQAEEYLGLRYARWALELDPAYEPAQTTFISLAVDKALERSGLEKPLAETAPDIHELLATVYPGALTNSLDRALAEKRTAVALGITRALAERADPAGVRGERGRPGALVRALDYPDRRVQFAAAEALLRLPPTAAHASQARVAEVLRRALAGDAESSLPKKGRILVGAFQPEQAQAMANAVRAAGYDAEVAQTGKDLMRRLKDRGDIDGVILDSELPYPPLPDTIASLRYDVHLGLLPVRIVYTPNIAPSTTYYITENNRRVEVGVPAGAIESVNFRAETRLRVLIEGYRQIGIVRGPLTTAHVQAEFAPDMTAEQVGGSPALTAAEKKSQSVRAIEWFCLMATGQVAGYDVRPAERTIRQALRFDDLARPAIEATSRLPGADPQIDLAAVVADAARPADLRLAAADALIRHIASHGVALNRQQAQTMMDLLPTLTDPNLKARVAAVVGSLRLTSPQSGQRMLRYEPPPPKPAATLEAPKPQ